MKQCISIPYLSAGASASYAIKKERGVLYIFFESSNGANDWKRNLDFPAKAYKTTDGTVWYAHRGFIETFKELEPFLDEHIRDKSNKSIVITGYSHGAALAVLCHEYAWFNRPDLRQTLEGYGFGCPRVLFRPPKQILERWERFTVIRNIDDLVTHLPPSALGYTHVGTLLEIGQKGKYSSTNAHRPENILKELFAYEKGMR